MDEVVLHALEKEPERRYQQASDVKSDVETIGKTSERATVPPPPPPIPPGCSLAGHAATTRIFGKTGYPTSVTIPNSVTNIGAEEAFAFCTSLTRVTIGTGVTRLGDDAFWNCNNLMGVYFLGYPPSHGLYVFSSDNNTTVYYTPWIWWPFTFGGRPTSYWYPPEYIYTHDNESATITQDGGPGGSVTIPSTSGDLPVTSIGDSTFEYCYSLTNITIPNSVTSIGNWASMAAPA
jgi:hypothetical protein